MIRPVLTTSTPSFLHTLVTVTGESTRSFSCMEHVSVSEPPAMADPVDAEARVTVGAGTAWRVKARSCEYLVTCEISTLASLFSTQPGRQLAGTMKPLTLQC